MHLSVVDLYYPLIAGLVILFIASERYAFRLGLYITGLTFIVSILLWTSYSGLWSEHQIVQSINWSWFFSDQPILFGLDGLSMSLVLLTTFIMPVSLLVSWDSVQNLKKEFVCCLILIELTLLVAFTTLDLLLFFISFEGILIPMFLMIGIWGSRSRKVHASYQFFLYTLFGGVLVLVAIIMIYTQVGTTDMITLMATDFGSDKELLLWFAFFISFAIKSPMIPVHIWLPEAHVEAPTAGSVILAGLLLKLGSYGMLRVLVCMFPYATVFFAPFVYIICAFSVLYAALTALRQVDMKKVIAYSSISHMNLSIMGIFSLTPEGLLGSILMILSHGIVSSALFICVGLLYDRYGTKALPYLSGFGQTMPVFTKFLFFFSIANFSFPGTFSFVAEFLTLMGSAVMSPWMTVMALVSTVVVNAYVLVLFIRLCGGSTVNWEGSLENVSSDSKGTLGIAYGYVDLTRREFFIMAVLAFIVVIYGIYPVLASKVLYGYVLSALIPLMV